MTDRKTAYNSGLASWGLMCFVETFLQGSTFVYRMNSSAKNPPQRQAAKRCALFKIAELGGKFWQFNPRKMPIV
jgi:hypothetical protein